MRSIWIVGLCFLLGCGESSKQQAQAPRQPPALPVKASAPLVVKSETPAEAPDSNIDPNPPGTGSTGYLLPPSMLKQQQAQAVSPAQALKSLYAEIEKYQAIKDQQPTDEDRQTYEKDVLKPMREEAADLAGQIVALRLQRQTESQEPSSIPTEANDENAPEQSVANADSDQRKQQAKSKLKPESNPSLPPIENGAAKTQYVKGYMKKNGTYVNGYVRRPSR